MADKENQAHRVTNETAQAIELLARQLKPQGPLEQAGLDQATIDAVTKAPQPRKYRMVPGKSEETGATFTLHVVESKKHPNGRITALADYKHPEGLHTYQSAGGRVPDGVQITRVGSGAASEGVPYQKSDYSTQYLQWRWESFWQTDLRRFVGKELQSHHCVDPNALKSVQWLEGKVQALRDQDEG